VQGGAFYICCANSLIGGHSRIVLAEHRPYALPVRLAI
jgi:hypothetical protein